LPFRTGRTGGRPNSESPEAIDGQRQNEARRFTSSANLRWVSARRARASSTDRLDSPGFRAIRSDVASSAIQPSRNARHSGSGPTMPLACSRIDPTRDASVCPSILPALKSRLALATAACNASTCLASGPSGGPRDITQPNRRINGVHRSAATAIQRTNNTGGWKKIPRIGRAATETVTSMADRHVLTSQSPRRTNQTAATANAARAPSRTGFMPRPTYSCGPTYHQSWPAPRSADLVHRKCSGNSGQPRCRGCTTRAGHSLSIPSGFEWQRNTARAGGAKSAFGTFLA